MAQLVKTINSLAIASCKTVSGLAIASVKTVTGVDNTSGGGGSPAFVQAQSGIEYFNSDTTVQVTLTSNVTAGNLIAVSATWETDTITISSVTDSLSNTYTLVGAAPVDGLGYSAQGAYAMNITGGACTITVTLSSASTNKTVAAVECSGCATTSALDGNAQKYLVAGAGTNGLTTDNFTTSTNGDILVGFMVSPGQSGGTITAGTSFTLRETDTSESENLNVETRIQATASASTVVAFTNSGFGDALIIGLAFKPA